MSPHVDPLRSSLPEWLLCSSLCSSPSTLTTITMPLLHLRMAKTWVLMRPVSTDSDGPAPPKSLSCSYPLVGSLPATEMSLLQSLGPVQNWLGQELEKCGIDAMIYTRYVLSLLLHDSYDYDLQDQVRFNTFNISGCFTYTWRCCSCYFCYSNVWLVNPFVYLP